MQQYEDEKNRVYGVWFICIFDVFNEKRYLNLTFPVLDMNLSSNH